jgi:hypothetical protein
MHIILPFCAALFTIVLSTRLGVASASEQAAKLTTLRLDWEVAIPDTRNGPPIPLPRRVLRTARDELIAVGNELVPLKRHGLGERRLLDTEALILDVALDNQGSIWVGGLINQRAWLPGADMADAYLGRFSESGKKLAEFTFGGLSWRQIASLHPLHDGGVIVSGPKANHTWLASISERGEVRWEKTIGMARRSTVTEGRDRNIAFVGLRKGSEVNRPHEEDVVFWLFDAKGNVLAERVIRRAINRDSSARYEDVAIEKAADGYFVLVRWGDPSDNKPLTVVKVSLAGTVQWTVQLEHTATPAPGRRSKTWNKCDQKQAVLANGDLMVTCSVEGDLVLSRLARLSGAEQMQRAILPACHENRPAVVTPIPLTETTVLLFGSRPSGNVGTSCNWLAEWLIE